MEGVSVPFRKILKSLSALSNSHLIKVRKACSSAVVNLILQALVALDITAVTIIITIMERSLVVEGDEGGVIKPNRSHVVSNDIHHHIDIWKREVRRKILRKDKIMKPIPEGLYSNELFKDQ